MAIYLFTDFGWQGPYVGQLKQAIIHHNPSATVIDLMHDVPSFNIRSAATLLSVTTQACVAGDIIVAVVDPGVGSGQSKPSVLKHRGRYFVGPDNGLFDQLALQEEPQIAEIVWKPDSLSNSFHGRDLFAPVAAMLSNQSGGSALLSAFMDVQLTSEQSPAQIIYQDSFGNCWSNILYGEITNERIVECGGHRFSYARTFANVGERQGFWYWNSQGLLELAANQYSAQQIFNIKLGDPLVIDIDR